VTHGTYGPCVEHHHALIFDRGGKGSRTPVLDLGYVEYSRDRDDTTEGIIRIIGDACDEQMPFLETLRTHRHELVIYRGDSRAWEGPLHRITLRPGFAEIVAKDISAYLYAQPLTQEYSNLSPNVDTVTGRIEKIIQYELSHGRTMFFPSTAADAAADVAVWVSQGGTATPVTGGWNIGVPPLDAPGLSTLPPVNVLPHLSVHHYPNEAETSMRTVPYQMTVGEHLDALSQDNGIDWTVIGRALHIWDTSRPNGTIRALTPADFQTQPILTEYGADHTQIAYSVGQNGTYGSAISLKNLGYYGGWSQIHTVYQEEGTVEPGQSELDGQARRNISGRTPAPVEVRIPDNSSVILSDTLTIEMLVPGARTELATDARDKTQLQKIDYVRVIEDENGEKVTITLTPASRPDSDVL
jgi:hypothetical protein